MLAGTWHPFYKSATKHLNKSTTQRPIKAETLLKPNEISAVNSTTQVSQMHTTTNATTGATTETTADKLEAYKKCVRDEMAFV